MSRRSVTRAVCAPLAIALVTTAIPPTISNSSTIHDWSAKTLSAALGVAGDGASRLGTEFDKHAQQSTVKIIHVREELAAQLSTAADAVVSAVDTRITQAVDAAASGANIALARIDNWLTSVSDSVIAMLPGGASEAETVIAQPAETKAPLSDGIQQTASLSAPAAIPAASLPAKIEITSSINTVPADVVPMEQSAPVAAVVSDTPAPQAVHQEPVLEIEKPSIKAPAEKTVIAALGLIETATAAVPSKIPAPVAEVKIETKAEPAAAEAVPVLKSAPEIVTESAPSPAPVEKAVVEEPSPVVEQTIARDTVIQTHESKTPEPKAEEKLLVASLSHPASAVETQPVVTPVLPVVESKAPETKPEEKVVVASLGDQASALDAAPVSVPAPAAAFKAAPETSSAETSANNHVIDPLQMTNIPMSAPLKIRALTRADIPSAEKVASLGPSGTASNLPAEQQRVAYDAPAEAETPISIGRRRWTEEAAKYQGLGSPEALLEALKHMGAGAKSLGLPASLWCADFMNLVLRKSGIPATGSRAAKSYLQYGQKINEPRVGAIAIFSRGSNGGHIGIVRGTDGKGNPIIVSGNHNHKVAEAVYPKERVLAYVVPR